MTTPNLLARLHIDPYMASIVGMVGLASALPVSGSAAVATGHLTQCAIALLFFLHGARLEPSAALSGARHWRLHIVVLLSTFILFPALGELGHAVAPGMLTEPLWVGVIFLCILPSTVQSSIAFTSIARGNVAAALCAATASNLIGMALTPLLAAILLHTHGGFSAAGFGDIAAQLLLPFLAGQLARPWIGGWISRNKQILTFVDRGSILLVVYSAFSEGVTQGIWHQLDIGRLAELMMIAMGLLGSVLTITTLGSRMLGFSRADEITIVFCGSKKSLATGLAMATVLLPAQTIGLVVLPLMLFHQVQLMACAALARRYASSAAPLPEDGLPA